MENYSRRYTTWLSLILLFFSPKFIERIYYIGIWPLSLYLPKSLWPLTFIGTCFLVPFCLWKMDIFIRKLATRPNIFLRISRPISTSVTKNALPPILIGNRHKKSLKNQISNFTLEKILKSREILLALSPFVLTRFLQQLLLLKKIVIFFFFFFLLLSLRRDFFTNKIIIFTYKKR